MQKITLVQLTTMTSGLAREPSGPPDHSRGPVSGWEAKVMASMPFVRFAHEPGTRFLYCNIGYAILGVALGRAAGQPYTAYVEQHQLAPLGMTRTAFEPTVALRAQVARGYEIGRDQVDGDQSVAELDGRGYRVPNGALFSTVDDLARFVSWQLGEGPDGILKAETREDNFKRVLSADGELRSGYGVGFDVARRGELLAYGHGGSTAGYRAAVRIDRAGKTGVIVLASVAGGKVNVGELALTALETLAASRVRTKAALAGSGH
jgi:CubicO group peptidase (beta-lactamase class C family)